MRRAWLRESIWGDAVPHHDGQYPRFLWPNLKAECQDTQVCKSRFRIKCEEPRNEFVLALLAEYMPVFQALMSNVEALDSSST